MFVLNARLPKISVRELLFKAFLTGWQVRGSGIDQDEYLESAIRVIEKLQVEPEFVYVEEGQGLPDGDEPDHLEDLLRADGVWLYYGVEEENFFLLQWYPDSASADQKMKELSELAAEEPGKEVFYPVDLTLMRKKESSAEYFGSSSPNMLHS